MWSDIFFRLRALFRRNAMEAELDQELRAHFEKQVEKHVRAGSTPEEARKRTRLEFGGLDQIKEECRDARGTRGTRALESKWQDLRHALRILRKTPAFTFIAVTILAVGIGSNAAVFSLIDALLLRSLAVPEPHRLVAISFGPPGNPGPLSGPMFDRLREQQGVFTDVFAWHNSPMVLTGNGAALPIQAAYASGSAFPVLGLKPRLGRLLEWGDDQLGGGSGGFNAVLSEAFWIEHFGGATAVLGKVITVDGVPARIVGVMPRSFNGLVVDYAPQVVLPFTFEVAANGKSSGRFAASSVWLWAMGRLRPGINYTQAEANLRSIGERVLEASLPGNYRENEYMLAGRLSLSPGKAGWSPLGEVYGRPLWTLQALVGMLMIVCCANLASLQLARALSRQHELVVRSALGAGRYRLVRQLLVESILIAVIGAGLGLLLSQWMSSLLVGYVEQPDFPLFLDLRLSLPVLACTIGLTTITVILAGALPAVFLTRFDADHVLRSGAQRNIGRKRSRLAAMLLPVQVGLSLLLASLAILFAFSTAKLLRVDPGFRVKGISLFPTDFSRLAAKGDERRQVYLNIVDALRKAPGVEAASMLAVAPLGEGGIDESAIGVEGNASELRHLFKNMVGSGYFGTVGTRIIVGREFSELDRLGTNPVCIVNQSAADFFFRGEHALGKHIRPTEPNSRHGTCEIIGVAGNARYLSLRQAAPPTIYYPYGQLVEFASAEFVTRSPDTALAVGAFREALRRFAPESPVLPAVTMERQLETSTGQERLVATLSLFFGGIALALTSIGLYGLETQRVTERRAELGLRVALGAQRRDVSWSILREAAFVFAVGVPVGVALTVVASHFVSNLLYETSPLDPRIEVTAVLIMLGVGLLAAYLPARRATQVDPVIALRQE